MAIIMVNGYCWVVCALLIAMIVKADPQVPCYFVFGDSVFDNGNNNYQLTEAKVNYPPYGVDFPTGPTGRFSNGRNLPDLIANLLGFTNFIPPFATSGRGRGVLQGLNYASGGSGILPETGTQMGGVISLGNQLKNHGISVSDVVKILGNKTAATQHLNKCLYSIGIGANDYINNYFRPQYYNSSKQFNPQQYADHLIHTYAHHITTLYNYGARKIALFGIGQIGCTLREIFEFQTQGCVLKLNDAAKLFNQKLISLVEQLNRNSKTSKFTYINLYGSDTVDFKSLGFTVANTSCCEVGNGQELCLPYRTPCKNRKEYVFWDLVHPTEAVSELLAKKAYASPFPTDSYPINLGELARSTLIN